jgi:hypothetical protein
MKLSLLRNLLMVDSAILFLLGAIMIFAPAHVLAAFHFKDLPQGVNYLIGLWGCVFVTLAWGYAVAATNPLKHRVWVQLGIARGALECILSLVYLQQGVVTFSQAGFSIIVAVIITIAYIALYPRRGELVENSQPIATTAQKP